MAEQPSATAKTDADLKLSLEIQKLEAEVNALRRPLRSTAVIAALITASVLAVAGCASLVIQWYRSDRDFKLNEIKNAKLELDMASLRQQRAALAIDVNNRNTELAELRRRIDNAVAALRVAGDRQPAGAQQRVAELTNAAARLRAATNPIRMVAGSIIASPDMILQGESARLSWNSFDATRVVISPSVGSVPPYGTSWCHPQERPPIP